MRYKHYSITGKVRIFDDLNEIEKVCLPLLRGNVVYDKGVEIPLGYAVSPFKNGEQIKI
jgi:hypothetical protein